MALTYKFFVPILLATISLLFAPADTNSAEITVGSISIQKTEGLFSVPILQADLVFEGASAQLSIQYPTKTLFLEEVIYSSNFSFVQGDFNSTFDNGITEATIHATELGPTASPLPASDTVCVLMMRFLRSGESQGDITPISLTVSGNLVDFDSTAGIITNDKAPQIVILPETDMSPAYPNPVLRNTIIKFSLARPSQVEFQIFNALGEKVEVLPGALPGKGSIGNFDYVLSPQEAMNSWVSTFEFEPVQYTLDLLPRFNNISSGRYTVYMIADGLVISQGLIIIK